MSYLIIVRIRHKGMEQEFNSHQVPTGKMYQGKGIKLTTVPESLGSLIQLSRHIRGSTEFCFRSKYGNILDLLRVPVHHDAIIELRQYWDASLRCFMFSGFQLAPTVEEYGEILRMSVRNNSRIYHYLGHLPSSGEVAKLLRVPIKEIKIVRPGQVDGIGKAFVEARLAKLAADKDWTSFCRVFALAIDGMILFPSSRGIIGLGAVSVFQSIEYHQINLVAAILAETYMSLS